MIRLAVIAADKGNTIIDDVLAWLITTGLQIGAIIVVAILAQWLLTSLVRRGVKHAIDRGRHERLDQLRKVARTQELTAAIMSQRTEQRAHAIGSLLRSSIAIAVWTIALLMILPLIGVNVIPVLASASVIGVALGFGAQQLVRDYLAGIFLIIEDQYGVGDIIDLGNLVGAVEEVALRYTRMRDLSGVVWYVRNGEILRVGNRSQGWTMATVDIPVAYDADLEAVRRIIERIAVDIDEDPAFDDMLLGTPSFAGVESVGKDVVTVRVTAKAVPQQQGPLSRAIRERVKVALDRAGFSPRPGSSDSSD
jgi:small conductance mechanosensitive channel